MNLIIDADLINPPTQLISFRELTFFAHKFLRYNILLETDNKKDIYVNYVKHNPWSLEYVEDILKVGEESGLRLSIEPNFSPSVITDHIDSGNVYYLLQCLGMRVIRFR